MATSSIKGKKSYSFFKYKSNLNLSHPREPSFEQVNGDPIDW